MRIAEKRATRKAAHAARDEKSAHDARDEKATEPPDAVDVTIQDATTALDDEAPRHESRQ